MGSQFGLHTVQHLDDWWRIVGGVCKMRGGVRPVDCFYEGENMLVIHPDECIGISAMPALSQKQTFSDVRFLSNDVRSASESCAVQLGVSAMGQKRTFMPIAQSPRRRL